MNDPNKRTLVANVLPFAKFWKWLRAHPNCVLSAGTPEAVLFDANDFHWQFGEEDDGTFLVQVFRAKDVVGEIAIVPRTVAYVQTEAKGANEVLFECIGEHESERVALYHFTLSHDYAADEPVKPGRFVH